MMKLINCVIAIIFVFPVTMSCRKVNVTGSASVSAFTTDNFETGKKLTEGVYVISSVKTIKTVSLSASSQADSVAFQLSTFADSNVQKFHIKPMNEHAYRISNAYSGRVLSVSENAASGDPVWQERYDGKQQQLWKIEKATGSVYRIINEGTGMSIDLAGGQKNGSALIQMPVSNNKEQGWQFSKVTATYVDVDANNFFRRTKGWIASDGCATIPLVDGRVIWTMGDSDIDNYDSVRQQMTCLFQVRNSCLLQPSTTDWNWQNTATLTGNPLPGFQSYFKNKPDDDYFMWPGNGFQTEGNDTIYVYNSPLKVKGKGWEQDGNELWAKVRSSDMKVVAYSELPDFKKINFGQGIAKLNDGYIYAFGSRQTFIYSNVFVARFKTSDPNSSWSFWTTDGWSTDVSEAKPLAEAASNGVAVCYANNRFYIFSTEFNVGCDQGTKIFVSTGNSPTGPFSYRKEVYEIPDRLEGHSPFFYGVNAHPEFNNGRNGLLITYNINGYGDCVKTCFRGWTDPDTYRPRAVRIPFEILDK